ncbi:MAG: DUF433 domain-containing protein [Crocosphaera sp.]
MIQTLVDIGNLITSDPEIQGGRAIIRGTGTTVGRIATLYKQGYSADDIVADKDYLTLAQVYAALAYYHANQQVIEADLAAEQAEYERLAVLNHD